MIEVAAGIIINARDELLICQRGPGGNCAYLWEFPGGKREPEESWEACLIRECREELDVEIEITGVFERTSYAYPDREILFTFFFAKLIAGQPQMQVHQAMRWVRAEQLQSYEFCPADCEIIRRLSEPGAVSS